MNQRVRKYQVENLVKQHMPEYQLERHAYDTLDGKPGVLSWWAIKRGEYYGMKNHALEHSYLGKTLREAYEQIDAHFDLEW